MFEARNEPLLPPDWNGTAAGYGIPYRTARGIAVEHRSAVERTCVNITLDRVILYVQNVRTLKEFYRDAFELTVIEEIEDEWTVFKAGHCELALHKAGKAYGVPDASSSRSTNNAKLVMRVHGDIGALRRNLIARGVPMGDVRSYPGFTGPICDGTDPEGNVFQLSQA